MRIDRAGFASLGDLAGAQAYGQWSPSPYTIQCGFLTCLGPEDLPGYYTAGAAVARSNGYSVPINAVPSGMGAGIVYVNPDGTMGRIDNWAHYPPLDNNGRPQQQVTDPAFIPPPMDVWFQYMTSLNVASIAAIQAANTQAAIDYANAQAGTANPGLNPSDYNPNPTPAPTSGGTTITQTNSSAGSLSFITSRGGTTLLPGDTWTIRIAGAAPNQAVSVYGVHPDGQTATNSMGTTDGQGNFVLSGTADATSLGNWQETWYVGNQSVGSFSFSVVSASGTTGGGGTLPVPTGGGGGMLPGTGGGTLGGSLPATIGGFPTAYVLGGGALVLLVLAMGGRR